MANEEQLAILDQGVTVWNKWRKENPTIKIDLSGANLSQASLNAIDLSKADLTEIDLHGASLKEGNLRAANLQGANLLGAYLKEAKLIGVNFTSANLETANFMGANLSKADLRSSNLSNANLVDANLSEANFEGATLFEAGLSWANLSQANLRGANLHEALLIGAYLAESDLREANLREANLREANFKNANLSGCNLSKADLTKAYLVSANLSNADLTEVDLTGASLVATTVDKAKVSGSSIYGIGVWDLKGEFEEQKDLIITPSGVQVITVDNIKIAQFIYMILNNEEIREVLNALTSRSVLILGRFAIPERKAILDALRNKLREYNLLPIVFDFERPTDKDFTETIKTLAGLSYFVIADVTNPKSSPLELQATVPDYQIPFVPIIQQGERPFAMMVDLQKKYNWVLDTLEYDSIDTLIHALKPAIIDPAIEKHNELRLIKAREPKIRSAKDFLKK